MNSHLRINYPAIIVCFFLLTALGFLWYGPLFGEPWMAMVGLDPATVEANPPGAGLWITNIVATIIPLVMLAWILNRMEVRTGLLGALIGFLIAFSFIFLTNLTGDLFAGNPYGLPWITGGYYMVALTLAGFILGAWKRKKPAA